MQIILMEKVVNLGGPVLKSPSIVPVFFAGDEASMVNKIKDFDAKIGATAYWEATTKEYGVGPATGLPMIEIATAAPTTTTDDQIQAFLADKLTNDPTFPPPDGQTLYSVFYPSGTTITLGADKGYDSKAFIKGCRKLKVTPHVAAKDKHSAVDARITRHEGYKTSQKVRKRIEEAFGWIKTVGGLAKTKLIGQAKLTGQALLCFATYNLVRMGSLGGWWDAHHA